MRQKPRLTRTIGRLLFWVAALATIVTFAFWPTRPAPRSSTPPLPDPPDQDLTVMDFSVEEAHACRASGKLVVVPVAPDVLQQTSQAACVAPEALRFLREPKR